MKHLSTPFQIWQASSFSGVEWKSAHDFGDRVDHPGIDVVFLPGLMII
jgi:hypothetical protein